MPRLTDTLVGSLSKRVRALASLDASGQTAEPRDAVADVTEEDEAHAATGVGSDETALPGGEFRYGPESVVTLLRDEEGRLWQGDLVERLDVSASTVSRWLASLEEDGRVERLRIGRENLVMLPEQHPDLAEPSLPPPDDAGR